MGNSHETAPRHEAPASPGGLAPYRLPLLHRIARLQQKPSVNVHVVDHCNLRCRGCVHFAPIAEPRFLDLDDLLVGSP